MGTASRIEKKCCSKTTTASLQVVWHKYKWMCAPTSASSANVCICLDLACVEVIVHCVLLFCAGCGYSQYVSMCVTSAGRACAAPSNARVAQNGRQVDASNAVLDVTLEAACAGCS